MKTNTTTYRHHNNNVAQLLYDTNETFVILTGDASEVRIAFSREKDARDVFAGLNRVLESRAQSAVSSYKEEDGWTAIDLDGAYVAFQSSLAAKNFLDAVNAARF